MTEGEIAGMTGGWLAESFSSLVALSRSALRFFILSGGALTIMGGLMRMPLWTRLCQRRRVRRRKVTFPTVTALGAASRCTNGSWPTGALFITPARSVFFNRLGNEKPQQGPLLEGTYLTTSTRVTLGFRLHGHDE